MSKRKVQFSENIDVHKSDENEENSEEIIEEPKVGFGKKFKHTLDSDESDDEVNAQNYDVLDCQQIIGQEDCTVDYEGDVRITPFNMNEELEEGHFDTEGNYIYHKSDEIHDSWLDRIDWLQIKQNSQQIANKSVDNNETDEESDDKTNFDYNSVYKEMITLMKPKESVQKAIQRLGKSCGQTKSSNRWKNKNDVNNEGIESTSCNELSDKEKLSQLSSLADKVLQTGDMDIYQRTYEELDFHLSKKSINSSVDSDMFSDKFDANISSNQEIKSMIKSDNEIKWEFKWEDTDSSQVFGPHSSQQMLDWVNDGYFQNGVYVRQIGKIDSQFYNSKRIDFDLYT